MHRANIIEVSVSNLAIFGDSIILMLDCFRASKLDAASHLSYHNHTFPTHHIFKKFYCFLIGHQSATEYGSSLLLLLCVLLTTLTENVNSC